MLITLNLDRFFFFKGEREKLWEGLKKMMDEKNMLPEQE